eukprot:scpid97947/ scgid22624/ 
MFELNRNRLVHHGTRATKATMPPLAPADSTRPCHVQAAWAFKYQGDSTEERQLPTLFQSSGQGAVGREIPIRENGTGIHFDANLLPYILCTIAKVGNCDK